MSRPVAAMLRDAGRAWVGFWDRREVADSLALVRILLGLLVTWDLLRVLQLDLVLPIFAPHGEGGMANVLDREQQGLLYTLLPGTAATAWGAYWVALGSAIAFSLGLLTPLANLLLLLLLAQLSMVLPAADRGIDMLVRNGLMVLLFSRCGAAWSLDALLRSGRLAGDRRPVPSWPRYLLVVQLCLLYSMAGVQKVASSWLPFDWSALWIAMHDPHFARFDAAWSWSPLVFQLTRLATFVTWLWEWSAPVILLAYWYRDTPDRPGRLRSFFNRHHLLFWWLLLGASFHVGTHLVLRLGIFPFAVLSLYPAFVHPDALAALARRLGGASSRAAAA